MNWVRLYQGDCLDKMALISDRSIDLVLCDLPYGITQNSWDFAVDVENLWAQYRRIVRGTVILTAVQPFATKLISSNLAWFRYECIWEKNKASGHLNAKRRPMRAHENILVFADHPPAFFPQMAEGHEPGHYAKRGRQSSNYGFAEATEYGGSTKRYPRTVLRFPVVNNDDPERIHPTQKPVPLMEYLIKTYTEENAIVLDNCMGAGTTGVAAIRTGRNFVGIELSEEYFLGAQKRIQSEQELRLSNELDVSAQR